MLVNYKTSKVFFPYPVLNDLSPKGGRSTLHYQVLILYSAKGHESLHICQDDLLRAFVWEGIIRGVTMPCD